MFTHSLHYPETQCFTFCRLVFCEFLNIYLSQSVFLLSLLHSSVTIQLSREVHFCVLVCMLYPFWYLQLFLSLNTATAIIADHSYFIWRQQPSNSFEPLKISFHTFQSSAAFKNIQNAIKEMDEKSTEVAAAIMKIALDNRLCRFLVFQQNFVISFLTPILAQ